MKITTLILLGGFASLALLTGCSKPAVPPPATTTSEASKELAAPQASVAAPAKPQQSSAEQAATLLQFIDTRPECQQFRIPLEQASASPDGAPTELNMAEIMDQAYKAGCQTGPG